MKNWINTLVLLCLASGLWATEESYSIRKNASSFASPSGFEIIIEDGRYAEIVAATATFEDASANLFVKFGVDGKASYGYIPTVVSLDVDIEITPYSNGGTELTGSMVTRTLTISYHPDGGIGFPDIRSTTATLSGYDYHKYKIHVANIPGTIPGNIYIEAELKVDRYYEIDMTPPVVGANEVEYTPAETKSPLSDGTPGTNGLTVSPTAHEIELWWDYIEGAEEYEVEWVWIDNYTNDIATAEDPTLLKFNERDFELNHTRILTNEQFYKIPLIYSKGFLIYRVRGVGRWIDNGFLDVNINKYGDWSTFGASIDGPGTTISNWPNYVVINSEHEGLKNWQFQAVFAEDGKKKEIVSYFDGSLRNRQTVTRINSNDEAIVGENIYDNQGRSAIQILPVPVDNNALTYYPSLNLNDPDPLDPVGPVPFSHRDFDWEDVGATGCLADAAPMSVTSGASKYYSNNNAPEGNWQDQVPVADRYPYVQIEYTPDNTGRIRRQSGAGEDYTIDGDHATQYFYLQPDQDELNRLFGYHVGNVAHYKKNLVVDANGQVSVSYLDPQGRVIATALAGTNELMSGTATNLLSLHEELTGNHTTLTTDVINKSGVDAPDSPTDNNHRFNSGYIGSYNDGLKVNTQVDNVEDGAVFDYNYRIRSTAFSDDCLPPGTTIPFSYLLDFNLNDDCGGTLIGEVTRTDNTVVSGPNTDDLGPGSISQALSGENMDFSYEFDATLDVGAFALSKRLRVDPDMLDEHVEYYLENATCLLTLEDFLEDNVDCDDDPEPDPDQIVGAVSNCFVNKSMMLSDLSPSGQYGATNGTDLLSVFTLDNVLEQGALTSNQNWQNPVTAYMNLNGSPAQIPVTHLGSNVYDPALNSSVASIGDLIATADPNVFLAVPEQLENLSDFLQFWESSWAESLLEYHPEYCYLAYAEDLCNLTWLNSGGVEVSSDEYDAALQMITTYDDAISTSNILGVDLIGATGDRIRLNDPYFNTTYPLIDINGNTGANGGNVFKNDFMTDIMDDYKRIYNGAPAVTLWEFAMWAVVCGNNLSGTCPVPTVGGLSAPEKDLAWALYKEFYIAEKKRINQIFVDCHAITNGCYNGYIGEAVATTPGFSGFFYYPDFVINPNYITLLTTGVNPAGTPSVAEFYYLANQAATVTTPVLPFPWLSGAFTASFENKIKRFIPISNLYDPTVPEDVALQTLTEETNQEVYEQTGRCDLSFDVEYFLNALAEESLLQTPGTSSDDLPHFTPDLYAGMNGSAAGSPVTITSTAIAGGINITATNASGSITLNSPTAGTWADVEGITHLYYIPGTFSGTTYEFEVLAHINTGSGIVEEVLTGSTDIAIGECSYDVPCSRPEIFGDEIGALYTELLALGHFDSPVTALGITSIIGTWYEGSEIQTQLNDASSLATVTTFGSGDFIIELGTLSINFLFLTPPVDLAMTTGYSFDETTGRLTIYYLDENGEMQEAIASVQLQDSGTGKPFDLECECELVTDFKIHFINMLNQALAEYHENGEVLVDGYSNLDLVELTQYATIPGPLGLHGFTTDGTGGGGNLVFGLDEALSCPEMAFFSISPGDLTTLTTVISIDFTVGVTGAPESIVLTGLLEDGTEVVYTAESLGCFDLSACNPCIPSTVKPESCNDQWFDYNAEITSLNASITDPLDQFPVYTEEEFCETNLAYVTVAYLHYLDVFTITDNNHDRYLSIAEFSNVLLNYGFADPVAGITLSTVVDDYVIFVALPGNEDVNWNQYANEEYLVNTSICPPAAMPQLIDVTVEFPCEQLTAYTDIVNASNQYDIYLQNVIDDFKQRYTQMALDEAVENLTETSPDKEYHYTLYYYDQAGNLIQTVPPKGIDRIDAEMDKDAIETVRTNNPSPLPDNTLGINDLYPDHNYQTQYEYNSLNQLVWQITPDGGESNFAYDALGRLAVSQNARQKADNQVSYTVYDGLGRIVEVGEADLKSTNFTFDGGRLYELGVEVTVSDIPGVTPVNFPDNITIVNRKEVTKTLYDELPFTTITDAFEGYADNNTRNRITGVMYYTEYNGTDEDYDNATFYDYDVHGNVKQLIQDIQDENLVDLEQNLKKTQYSYDLVSGNVNEVTYQEGQEDQFSHRYCYDADNRITIAETSKDGINWEKDAKYFYYDHGPLARTEIGEEKVQSCDYAYTIQGWLKGVNSEDLEMTSDQGQDGLAGTTNQMNGRDVTGFSLHYFDGDYENRLGTNDFLAYSSAATPVAGTDLFNGNIKDMYTASTSTDEEYIGTSHTWYKYDQLNRIRTMDQEHLDGVAAAESRYSATYTYDPNGNLKTLTREAWADLNSDGIYAKELIDNFTYEYFDDNADEQLHNNRLKYVHDPLGSVLGNDLDDQEIHTSGTNYNYAYDQIGQLVKDKEEEISDIEWTVTGKVRKITRESGSSKSNLHFDYDAMGNRIIKTVMNSSDAEISKTYYLRDAQGNVLTTYTLKFNDPNGTVAGDDNLYLSERHIYGSSRVGLEGVDQIIASYQPLNVNINNENDPVNELYVQHVGDKRYELSNHLGNVLQVISDRKLTISDDGVNVDYYVADVLSQSDYYPFGMLLPGRNESGDGYRYGFNGMEMDDEVTGSEGSHLDFGARIYDSRMGRFLSRDPREKEFPFISPFCYAANSVIKLIDQNGEGPIIPFQSFTASETMRATIISYKAGDISKAQLNAVVKEFMDMPFTAVRHANHAKDQFSLNNLGDNGNMHQGGGKLILDKEYSTNYRIPGPDVAYQKGIVDDMFMHFILIEEDGLGNWQEVEETVLDQDLFLERLENVNEDINYWQSELDAIDEEIKSKKHWSGNVEKMIQEDHIGKPIDLDIAYDGMGIKFNLKQGLGVKGTKLSDGQAGSIMAGGKLVQQWSMELKALEAKRVTPEIMLSRALDYKKELLKTAAEADPDGNITGAVEGN